MSKVAWQLRASWREERVFRRVRDGALDDGRELLWITKEEPALGAEHGHQGGFHAELAGFIDHGDIESSLAGALGKQGIGCGSDDVGAVMIEQAGISKGIPELDALGILGKADRKFCRSGRVRWVQFYAVRDGWRDE